MLYYLFEWLHKLNFPGAGMFGYTSFRALMAVILALLISSIWGDKFINLLKRKQITETQRDAKTDPFGVNKVGVPSMGGVIIIVAILIPCLLLGKLHNIYMILMLITTVWLGSLGFADDYIKRQRGFAWQVQDYRSGRFRFNCRNDLVFKSGRSDP
jgi:phospho-N-acetylmuramoyl-pentapeptide-transferase